MALYNIKYYIGHAYQYPGPNGKVFVLSEVLNDGMAFKFKGGHSVTDNVFLDLIHVPTGLIVRDQSQQLTLF